MGPLVRLDLQPARIGAVRVLDLAPALAIFGVEEIAQDREEPRIQIGAALEAMEVCEGAEEGVLNKVVRFVDLT